MHELNEVVGLVQRKRGWRPSVFSMLYFTKFVASNRGEFLRALLHRVVSYDTPDVCRSRVTALPPIVPFLLLALSRQSIWVVKYLRRNHT